MLSLSPKSGSVLLITFLFKGSASKPLLRRGATECDYRYCPQIKCAPGHKTVILDGDCCPSCELDCSMVLCDQPNCPVGYESTTEPGQCCGGPCKPKCNLADCPPLLCPFTETHPGECCPVCTSPPPIDCSLVFCDQPICPFGYESITQPGQCCGGPCQLIPGCKQPQCREPCPAVCKCDLADCPPLFCPYSETPPGECCPVCASPHLDCSVVKCTSLQLCGPGFELFPLPGQCCGGTCVEKPPCNNPPCERDCSTVICPSILCSSGSTPFTKPGECCASHCVPNEDNSR